MWFDNKEELSNYDGEPQLSVSPPQYHHLGNIRDKKNKKVKTEAAYSYCNKPMYTSAIGHWMLISENIDSPRALQHIGLTAFWVSPVTSAADDPCTGGGGVEVSASKLEVG